MKTKLYKILEDSLEVEVSEKNSFLTIHITCQLNNETFIKKMETDTTKFPSIPREELKQNIIENSIWQIICDLGEQV